MSKVQFVCNQINISFTRFARGRPAFGLYLPGGAFIILRFI